MHLILFVESPHLLSSMSSHHLCLHCLLPLVVSIHSTCQWCVDEDCICGYDTCFICFLIFFSLSDMGYYSVRAQKFKAVMGTNSSFSIYLVTFLSFSFFISKKRIILNSVLELWRWLNEKYTHTQKANIKCWNVKLLSFVLVFTRAAKELCQVKFCLRKCLYDSSLTFDHKSLITHWFRSWLEQQEMRWKQGNNKTTNFPPAQRGRWAGTGRWENWGPRKYLRREAFLQNNNGGCLNVWFFIQLIFVEFCWLC